MDDLLVYNTDCVPLKEFTPVHNMRLWWNTKVRQLNRYPTKSTRSPPIEAITTHIHSIDSQDSSNIGNNMLLGDWDKFTM